MPSELDDLEHASPAQIIARWGTAFRELESHGPPHTFSPRALAGLYAVASICYHGNDRGPIPDPIYDHLCRWLCEHFDEAEAAGADKLDRQMLRCCTGYDVSTFSQPYHYIAGLLSKNGPCRCIHCTTS